MLRAPFRFCAGLSELRDVCRTCLHAAFTNGMGTKDLAGPDGLSTEQFVEAIGRMLDGESLKQVKAAYSPTLPPIHETEVLINDIDDVSPFSSCACARSGERV